MAKKDNHHPKTFNVAVVGLSGTEKEKGCMGIGKSCLCNRFVRPLADDYYIDHISVLSQTDFSGRVVNNDHWLYWGEVTKTTEEGSEITFSVIEQTEFIDDSCFATFKTGKTEPYFKRCAALRLNSAEKLMYVCKNQLGIEKEYEQKYLTDGRFNVDAFVCAFDVSKIQGRSLDKSLEFTFLVLTNLIKTKKPVIIATTKHDEANEYYIREVERLANRKEFKGMIPIIETSAHENVNVDLAFMACLQSNERAKGKIKYIPYFDALRAQKERLDFATEAYQSLIRSQVTDYRSIWNSAYKKLSQSQDFLHYCDLFGQDNAQQTFKRHIKKLKDDVTHRKMQSYLHILPDILAQLFPDLDSLNDNRSWSQIKMRLREMDNFDQYILDHSNQSWQESESVNDVVELKIPFELLETREAEKIFLEHLASLEAEDRLKEMKHQFRQLLSETGYVTPAKSFNEVRVLFMGRECYESLSEHDLNQIYDDHQRDITQRAKINFQELLLEYTQLFYHLSSLASGNMVTQEDIYKINEAISEDIRYKALDRLEEERTLIILRYLEFVHSPSSESCSSYPNCMDVIIESILADKSKCISFELNNQWLINSENNHLNIILLGINGLTEELSHSLKKVNLTLELEKIHYTLDFRIIDGDIDLPQYSLESLNFFPQGCFLIYSNFETLDYLRESLEKALLSNLEQQNGSISFNGLPTVLFFSPDPDLDEKDVLLLRKEGSSFSKHIQCLFFDYITFDEEQEEKEAKNERYNQDCIASALKSLIKKITKKVDLIQIHQSISNQILNPDLRILMCMFCGDPFSTEKVLNPFLNHNFCFITSCNSVALDLIVCESERLVEFIFTSYHGAGAYRDDLLHGFILVYSASRKASLSSLSAFSFNIPNTPTQIIAIPDTDNHNLFYSNRAGSQYINEGSSLAEKLQAYFTIFSPSVPFQNDLEAFLTEALDRKPHIEKAFEMDDSDYSLERRVTPIPPPIPSRQESNTLRDNLEINEEGDSDALYEQLTLDEKSLDNEDIQPPGNFLLDKVTLSPSMGSELYNRVFNEENGEHLIKPSQIKNRRGLQTASPSPPPLPLPPFSIHLNHLSPQFPTHHHHQHHHQSPLANPSSTISSDPSHSSALLYATNRKHYPLLQQPIQSKKSNRCKRIGPSRPLDDIEVSDEITDDDDDDNNDNDDDDDTVSSGLSGYGAYPPPPEPAPPDFLFNRSAKLSSFASFGHQNPNHPNINSELWMDNRLMGKNLRTSEEWLDNDVYQPYLSERHKLASPESKSNKIKPGKLNLKQFDNITNAVGRMSLTHQPNRKITKSGTVSKQSETQFEQSKYKDGYSSHDYPYGLMFNQMPENKSHRVLPRRSKDSPLEKASDSDSDWSSLERLQRDPYRINRKAFSHKKIRKKRGIPVAPPRLPSFDSGNSLQMSAATHQSSISSGTSTQHKLLSSTSSSLDTIEQAKLKIDPFSCIHSANDDDVDISSNDTIMGMMLKNKSALVVNDIERYHKERKEKERKKMREDEKNEKRRLKEEERQKKNVDKKKKKQNKANSINSGSGLEKFAQSESNCIPLFVEKCINFIESEGLDSEGIYRVPGNRAHVDLLFHKFDEDANISIKELDIPVNAVATALKDFFSKRLPPLIPPSTMADLTEVVVRLPERHERLLALQKLIRKLPVINFEIIKYVFAHFVKITENSRLNSMDSKNLAICWWPTLLPVEFNDMMMFERMRPYLEESVQGMIDQFNFIFCDEDERVLII